MPSTLPSRLPVPRNDSRQGTSSSKTSSLPSSVPSVKSENGAGCAVVVQRLGGGHLHRLHLGHDLALVVAGDAGAEPGDEQRRRRRAEAAVRNASTSRSGCRIRCQSAIRDHERAGDHEAAEDRVREGRPERPCWSAPPRSRSARRGPLLGVDRVADRVLHERVGGEDEVRREHRADRGDPDRGEVQPRRSRSQPKIHRPRNVDSRKNASSPSIASGAPKMSPTKRE